MRALILAVVLLLLPAAVHAQASERKVALVIANGSYCAAGVLANPANDARLVGGAARRAGFEVVSAQNADLANFQRACVISGPRPTARAWRWSIMPGTASKDRARTG